MKKRITSLLLSAALLLSVLSVPAFAAQPEAAVEAAVTEEAQPAVSDEENAGGTDETVTVTLPAADAEEQTAADEQPAAGETAAAAAEETSADAEQEEQITYVALGDSICAGVGLVASPYHQTNMIGVDMTSNFENYPEECYVGQVAELLGLDRQHAINLGLPGLMSGDLLELVQTGTMSEMNMLSGAYYNYPQILDYLKEADVISVQIGSNDAFVPCVVALGNATNWKSEDLAAIVLSGNLRSGSDEASAALSEGLSKMKLTREETNATWKFLTSGMSQICSEAYPTAAENLRQIVQTLRELNPDAQIIIVGCTNPVPLISSWSKFFKNINNYEKQLAEVYGVTYVSIPWAQTEIDAHPTASGHRYIARRIVKAINK